MQSVPATSSRASPVHASLGASQRRREPPMPDLARPAASATHLARPARGRRGACPPLHESFISRPRLVSRLLEDREASLVLLAAPAGYGKTSTLSEWAECDARPFAWVTLREDDNDPRRLLASLALAVEQLRAVDRRYARRSAVRLLGTAVLPGLLEALGTESAGAVLVLDDVQVVRSRESLEVLARLAGAMPAGAKLVLASRTAPALALARVRAQHELLVLGARELAMTVPEAGALLAAAGLELDSDELELAVRRTEGWPAALYLASIAIREEADAGGALARFAAEEELVSLYVREEVLAQMPPGALPFLVDTAILEELSAELCDVVLGRVGSGLTLRALAAGNLLITPIDRGHRRYRCHPLLREVLQAELSRMDPARARKRHKAAAGWFAERGQLKRALGHAMQARDLAHVGRLMWAQAPRTLFEEGETGMPADLDGLTAEQTASVPTLALLVAHRSLFNGDLRSAAHWTQVASGAHRCDPAADTIPGFAAGLALAQAAVGEGGVARMAQDAARGYELADAGSPWRAACCLLGGVAQRLAGAEHSHARELLNEGARCSGLTFHGLHSHCTSQLAVLAAEEQDWESAADLVERAGAALERAALCDQPTSALVLGVSAWVCSQQGRIDEAKSDLSRSLQLLAGLKDFIPWYEVETRVLLARTAIRLADIALARTQLSQASRIARRMPEVAVFRAWFDEAWGRIDGLSAAALGGPSSLTMAELRILRFLPTHLSFREIGSRLHVSTNTVKSQVHAVYRKLDAASRSEAVEHASSLGLIDVCI